MSTKLSVNKLLFLTFSVCLFATPSTAQIAADETTSTQINSSDSKNFDIDGGDRKGNNLFHSFDRFSIPTNGSANFLNPSDIDNIINRVTGGKISNIDGLIKANGNANLFLINPAGIVFGKNASLNIGGSFLGSTADSLVFPDGEFSASNTKTKPLLSVNAPIGLNFRDNPNPISNNSQAGLQVKSGNNITFVGGDLNFDGGKLIAPGGRIELGSLFGTEKIGISTNGSLTFPEDVARGDITLTNNAEVNVRAGNGGFITVNARNLQLSGGSQLFAGIAEDRGSKDAVAGDITINATDSVTLIGEKSAYPIPTDDNPEERTIEFYTATGIRNNVGLSSIRRSENSPRSNAKGNAGNVIINTDRFNLVNVTGIDTSSYGDGNSGNININTKEVSASGGRSFLITNIKGFEGTNFTRLKEKAIGNAGNININTGSLTFADQTFLLADLQTQGKSGNININATGDVSFALKTLLFTSTFSFSPNKPKGDAGNINITANNLAFENRAFVLAFTSGEGNAGNINITASGDVILSDIKGIGKVEGGGSLLQTQVLPGAIGEGGDIKITANKLSLQDKGFILADTQSQGDAGDITVNVKDGIFLSGSSILLTQVFPGAVGDGGNIDITTNRLSLQDKSFILADTKSKGNAGNITVNAKDSVSLVGDSKLITAVGVQGTNVVGKAGDIKVSTRLVSLKDFSSFSANTNINGTGEAGKIIVNADNLSITQGAFLDAFTENISDGSDINVNAKTIELRSGGKIVTGTAKSGNAGNINLNVSDSIIIDGSNPRTDTQFKEGTLQNLINETGLFSDTIPNSAGNGGSIKVSSPRFEITNGGKVAVDSKGSGNGGSLSIAADSLKLNNRASILASTQFGTGGNINLKIDDILQLDRNNLISAKAFQNAAGGNVTIDAQFIVATPNQNNDIVANAEQGKGGNINIITEGIFGLEQKRSTPPNQTNDIDASSDFGLEGSVSITTPDVNPSRGLFILPEDVVKPDETVAQACSATNNTANTSNFTIIGRGGLPVDPTKTLTSNGILAGEKHNNSHDRTRTSNNSIDSNTIIPARGIAINDKGEIVLSRYPSHTAQRNYHNAIECNR